ncbi:inositol-3-phosphate synthase [Demequina sp. SO4-13]|uniref:inositol-3-phosphate synthase n=1 Tax=Demequina sp. SO4-13 TaxID=3401027 RepID=UPI003AF59DEB
MMHRYDGGANDSAEPDDAGTPSPVPFQKSTGRVGLWLVGARGSVATTATLGLAAIAGGHTTATGCVTASGPLADAPLPGFDEIVVGGHDVTDVSMVTRAETLVHDGMVNSHVMEATRGAIARADAEVRPGYTTMLPAGMPPESQQAAAERLAKDMSSFRDAHQLDHVVVVDLTSTEAVPEPAPEFFDDAALRTALADPARKVLPPSSVTAYAAILARAPYACFTPSAGMNLPVLMEWATEAGIPVAGQDGKTGQTWLRTVLAPAFAARGLKVLSWAGANLLGGGDGATLADPVTVQSKLASKTRGLQSLTGSDVTPLHIDNVPDLGNTKIAWDHVHVEGFLGSRLTLQTTWSAYDSMLAAPMVLDLARLLSLAARSGHAGPVSALGFFFKDPWSSDTHDFAGQTRELAEWVEEASRRVESNAQHS